MSTGDPPWWTYMGAEITLDAIRKLVVRETFQNPDALEREKAVQEQVDALKARIDAMNEMIDRMAAASNMHFKKKLEVAGWIAAAFLMIRDAGVEK